MGGKSQDERVRSGFEKKLERAASLKERADLIVDFCLKFRGNYQDYRNTLIKYLLEEGSHYALGSAYNALIWASIDAGQYKEGVNYALKAQAQYILAGEKGRELQALNGEASALKALGKFDQALNRYLDGLEQAKEIEDRQLIILFLTNLGGLMNALGQYDEAILYFQELLDLKDPEVEQDASIFYMLGLSYHLKNDCKQAKPLFLKGAELSRKQGQKYLNALCEYRLGQGHISQGKVSEGEKLIRKVLAKSEELQIPTLKTNTLIELAEIAKERGNYQKALAYALKAAEIAKATEGKESLLKKTVVLAEIQGSLGDFEQAYYTLQEARELELAQYNTNLLNSLKIAKAKQIRRENMIYKTLYERINTISLIGQAITSTFELREIGEILWANLKFLMPVDTLAIGICEKEKNEINFQIFLQDGEFLTPFNKSLRQEWLQEIKEDGTHFKQPNLTLHHPEHTPKQKNLSLLYAPLYWRNETLGTIGVQSIEKDAYKHYHRDILRALAAYTGIALENVRLFGHVKELASVDSLTNLYNRRFVFEIGEKEFMAAKRYQTPLAVIMIDVDGLKKINDSYGHAAGDKLLQEAAAVFANNIRVSDTAGRIGGDEFLLILPNTNAEQARELAVRLKDDLAKISFRVNGSSVQIGASFGATEISPGDNSLEDTITRADQYLYQAKKQGGNLVIAAN